MRFLVDAQLPVRLCDFLSRSGYDAVHVSALPNGDRSSDAVIAETADAEERIVVELITLVDTRINDLANAFGGADLVELHQDLLVVHQRR